MKPIKPVQVTKGALLCCRIVSTLVLYVGMILQSEVLIGVIVLLMFISYLVKVRKSPLVFFYMNTFDRLWPSKEEYVNENAIAMAHLVGSILLLIGAVLWYFDITVVGYVVIGFVVIMKTVGIFGFCTVSKLYECSSSGCCRWRRKKND